MFRRRRDREDADLDAEQQSVDEAGDASAGDDPGAAEAEEAKPARPDGPWDADEIDLDDPEVRRGRLDLGALVVKGRPSMQLRIDIDPQSRKVRSVTFVSEGSALQLQAFAGPRTTALWPEVRAAIAADCTRRGGQSAELDGPYGSELRIALPVTTSEGKTGVQASRIVGVDGPRWLLRASFLGAAVDPVRAGDLLGVLRDVVVVRGQEPMAPRDMLALRVPAGPAVGVVGPVDGSPEGTGSGAAAGRPPLSPFRRGPEITEIN